MSWEYRARLEISRENSYFIKMYLLTGKLKVTAAAVTEMVEPSPKSRATLKRKGRKCEGVQ